MAEEEKNERVKRKTLAMLEKQRQAAIRRDMGFFDFYFQPQQRKCVQELRASVPHFCFVRRT